VLVPEHSQEIGIAFVIHIKHDNALLLYWAAQLTLSIFFAEKTADFFHPFFHVVHIVVSFSSLNP
jgi:hypothetical protein